MLFSEGNKRFHSAIRCPTLLFGRWSPAHRSLLQKFVKLAQPTKPKTASAKIISHHMRDALKLIYRAVSNPKPLIVLD